VVKILNQYFPGRLFVLLATENLLILCGLWAVMAYQIRGAGFFSPISDPTFFSKAFAITLLCQLCFYYADIYDLRNLRSKVEVAVRVVQAAGAAALILAAIYYIFPQARLGEGIVETSLVGIIVTIVGWRVLLEWLNRAYGAGERVLLVGSGFAVQELAHVITHRKDLPITVVGIVAEEGQGGYHDTPELQVVGALPELEKVIASLRPERLIIALRERRQQLPLDLLLHHRLRGVVIEEASTLFQKITGRVPVESIHPSALIFTDGFRQSRLRRVSARMLDFFGAIVGLIIFSPLLLLIALAIKLSSPGPVFYRQERVGRNGTTFEVMKFRSMRTDAEKASGPVWATEDDPRITKVGKLLRKLRLDELPQFLNVLAGNMSFVGPRPERPHFVNELKETIPFYDLRHSVRPGITGWAQVCYSYGATVEDSKVKLEYDLFYIKNNSISFDCLILFQTIKIMLFGKGAR
jgi:sugar transferase (PEP-CTERM system associated)